MVFFKYVAPGRTTVTEWVVLHPGILRQHKLKLREGQRGRVDMEELRGKNEG